MGQQPEHTGWYALRVDANGETLHSRAAKFAPDALAASFDVPMQLPMSLQRTLYLGPATPLFASLLSHAAPSPSASDAACRVRARDGR